MAPTLFQVKFWLSKLSPSPASASTSCQPHSLHLPITRSAGPRLLQEVSLECLNLGWPFPTRCICRMVSFLLGRRRPAPHVTQVTSISWWTGSVSPEVSQTSWLQEQYSSLEPACRGVCGRELLAPQVPFPSSPLTRRAAEEAAPSDSTVTWPASSIATLEMVRLRLAPLCDMRNFSLGCFELAILQS